MSIIPAKAAPAQEAAAQEVRFNVYFSNPKSMQFVSSRGKALVFINGRFTTKDPGEIADLEAVCTLRPNGSIFKDPAILTLSESDLDPMNALKAKFFKEFQEQQAANLNPDQDFGATVQERLKAASTSSIQAVTVK